MIIAVFFWDLCVLCVLVFVCSHCFDRDSFIVWTVEFMLKHACVFETDLIVLDERQSRRPDSQVTETQRLAAVSNYASFGKCLRCVCQHIFP